jgi:predicted enzyme related to lactoylglutathione lyase
MPKNLIQHHEWNTRDPRRLQTFYSKLFDWKFNDKMMPGYTMIDGIGGIFEITPEMGDMPTGVTNYVNVDDLDAKEKLIRAAGGTIYKSKQEVPNMGWFTIFADPDNNTVAMWQNMKKPARAVTAAKKSAKKVAKTATKTTTAVKKKVGEARKKVVAAKKKRRG